MFYQKPWPPKYKALHVAQREKNSLIITNMITEKSVRAKYCFSLEFLERLLLRIPLEVSSDLQFLLTFTKKSIFPTTCSKEILSFCCCWNDKISCLGSSFPSQSFDSYLFQRRSYCHTIPDPKELSLKLIIFLLAKATQPPQLLFFQMS